MKKMIFAVLAAFVMTLGFTSCSKNKADQMLDDMEAIVEKVEKAADESAAMAAALEVMSIAEKYGDLSESDFSEAQAKRAEELNARLDKAMEKFQSEVEEAAEEVEEAVEGEEAEEPTEE